MVTTRAALTAQARADGTAGLRITPYFTTPGVHPYEEVEWEIRDAVITDHKTGGVAFEQRDVEFPKSWSLNATTIVAQKYFRGTDRKSTRLNSSHVKTSYAVICLKKKN